MVEEKKKLDSGQLFTNLKTIACKLPVFNSKGYWSHKSEEILWLLRIHFFNMPFMVGMNSQRGSFLDLNNRCQQFKGVCRMKTEFGQPSDSLLIPFLA